MFDIGGEASNGALPSSHISVNVNDLSSFVFQYHHFAKHALKLPLHVNWLLTVFS